MIIIIFWIGLFSFSFLMWCSNGRSQFNKLFRILIGSLMFLSITDGIDIPFIQLFLVRSNFQKSWWFIHLNGSWTKVSHVPAWRSLLVIFVRLLVLGSRHLVFVLGSLGNPGVLDLSEIWG
jgi:hypothetical protein